MKQMYSQIIIVISLVIFMTNNAFTQDQYIMKWSKEEPSQILPYYTSDCPSVNSNECQKVRLDSENNVIVGGSSLENGNFDFW